MIVLTRDQVRNLDRIAVERFGIPGICLMENAGRGAAEVFLRHLSPSPPLPTLVVAGRGNNGGDGFVIARHLANRGVPVRIALLGEPEAFQGPGDAGTNFHIVERMEIPRVVIREPPALEVELARAGAVIDALLGTGLSGEVRGPARAAIERINASGRPVFAVDIPSGLDCDTGRPLGAAVRARATATFAAMKQGLAGDPGREFAGVVEVVDIGCPLVWT